MLDHAPPLRGKKSGSQTRQRHCGIYVACTPDEKTAITAKATATGLSAGGYVRACALGKETPRTLHRAPVDRELLGLGIAELRRVGNNINQLAHTSNQGLWFDPDKLKDALRDYAATLEKLREALR
jgi:hypothetical protein